MTVRQLLSYSEDDYILEIKNKSVPYKDYKKYFDKEIEYFYILNNILHVVMKS